MTASEVLKIIEAAFRDAPMPGDDDIAGARTPYRDEYAYVAEYFKGKHWREITLQGLRDDYPGPPDACLSFMSKTAFQFHLPAYMSIAIQHYDAADVVADSAINALLPNKDESLRSWWEDRTSGFTQPQRKAIVKFLEYMDDTHSGDYPAHGPKEALSFWRGSTGP